jgi:hypothetical protein
MSEEVKKEIEGVVTDVYKALDVLGTTRLKEMSEEATGERLGILAGSWDQAVYKIENATGQDSRFQTRLEKVEKCFAKLAKLDFSVLDDGGTKKMFDYLGKKIEGVDEKIKEQFKKKEKREKGQDKFQF